VSWMPLAAVAFARKRSEAAMTSEEAKDEMRKLRKQLRKISDDAAMRWADESDSDFIDVLIAMQAQLEPQLACYDPATVKWLCMTAVVNAVEARKELEMGTKVVSKIGAHRCNETRRDGKGR
jgi:hypothetical protein